MTVPGEESRAEADALIVDDDPLALFALEKILKSVGHRVRRASNGAAAVAAVAEALPDIIFLDVTLPDFDGFEVCRRIRLFPGAEELPIIFLSGHDDSPSKVQGLTVGGTDYLTKPFDREELVLRASKHIETRRSKERAVVEPRRRLEALREAQRLFLTDPASVPGARCRLRFLPSEEAGGDLYDIVDLGAERTAYFLLDVAGHGVGASLHANVLRALFRELLRTMGACPEIFIRLSSLLREEFGGTRHATALLLVIDRGIGEATLISAGHFPVIACDANGVPEEWSAEGDVLGAFETPTFIPSSRKAGAGSRFWLFSDGVIEDHNHGLAWREGLDRLSASVAAFAARPLDEALELISRERLREEPRADDWLLLVCET